MIEWQKADLTRPGLIENVSTHGLLTQGLHSVILEGISIQLAPFILQDDIYLFISIPFHVPGRRVSNLYFITMHVGFANTLQVIPGANIGLRRDCVLAIFLSLFAIFLSLCRICYIELPCSPTQNDSCSQFE